MSRGWVGILSAELHFPEAHSLKEKRGYLRSAKAQLQNRFGAAVAEVDHHDVWHLARITATLVHARSARGRTVSVRTPSDISRSARGRPLARARDCARRPAGRSVATAPDRA